MQGSASSGTWPAYVRAAREGAGLTKTELGRLIKVDRGTIHRWEIGERKPLHTEQVVALARALELDPNEALAAAGFRIVDQPPSEPTRRADPEIDRILRSSISTAAKRKLIERITERRDREQRQRLDDLEDLIRAQERLER